MMGSQVIDIEKLLRKIRAVLVCGARATSSSYVAIRA
jgi:hypothetical protein